MSACLPTQLPGDVLCSKPRQNSLPTLRSRRKTVHCHQLPALHPSMGVTHALVLHQISKLQL